MVKVRLTNITLTADLGQPIDLFWLYETLQGEFNVVFEPEISGRRVLVTTEDATVIVYNTGKVQVVGAKSLEAAVNALIVVANSIRHNLAIKQQGTPTFT